MNIDIGNTTLVVLDANNRFVTEHETEREALDASEKVAGGHVERMTREQLEAHKSNQRA